MNNIMSRVVEITQKRWSEIKQKEGWQEEGWTKEDVVVYALEFLDENGQFYDPTKEEYEEAINSIY